MAIRFNTQDFGQVGKQQVSAPSRQPLSLGGIAQGLQTGAEDVARLSALSKTLTAAIKPALDVKQEISQQQQLKEQYDKIVEGVGVEKLRESQKLLEEKGVYRAYENLTTLDKNGQLRAAQQQTFLANSQEYQDSVLAAGDPNLSDQDTEVAFQEFYDSMTDKEVGTDAYGNPVKIGGNEHSSDAEIVASYYGKAALREQFFSHVEGEKKRRHLEASENILSKELAVGIQMLGEGSTEESMRGLTMLQKAIADARDAGVTDFRPRVMTALETVGNRILEEGSNPAEVQTFLKTLEELEQLEVNGNRFFQEGSKNKLDLQNYKAAFEADVARDVKGVRERVAQQNDDNLVAVGNQRIVEGFEMGQNMMKENAGKPLTEDQVEWLTNQTVSRITFDMMEAGVNPSTDVIGDLEKQARRLYRGLTESPQQKKERLDARSAEETETFRNLLYQVERADVDELGEWAAAVRRLYQGGTDPNFELSDMEKVLDRIEERQKTHPTFKFSIGGGEDTLRGSFRAAEAIPLPEFSDLHEEPPRESPDHAEWKKRERAYNRRVAESSDSLILTAPVSEASLAEVEQYSLDVRNVALYGGDKSFNLGITRQEVMELAKFGFISQEDANLILSNDQGTDEDGTVVLRYKEDTPLNPEATEAEALARLQKANAMQGILAVAVFTRSQRDNQATLNLSLKYE